MFKLLIETENEINNFRRTLGILRIKLRDVFGLIDLIHRGYFTNDDLIAYVQNQNIEYNQQLIHILNLLRVDPSQI